MPKFSFQHIFESGDDADAPPLLLLHATGGNEQDLLRLARHASPGSALLSPRGNVVQSGSVRFFSRIADSVFDPQEVSRRAQALADFVESAAKHYHFDISRLVAFAHSNGADVASAILLLRPDTLGGAILFRPMFVLDLPAAPESLVGKRILITHGSTDPLIPSDHPRRLAELLRAGGAEVTSRTFAASHALVAADIDAAHDWLQVERSRISIHR